jgi:hypothetical protein
MLNKEQKAAAINIAMMLEEHGYPQLEMDYMFGKLCQEEPQYREDLISFLYANSPCTYRLYLELMKQLPSVSNEPVISFTIK